MAHAMKGPAVLNNTELGYPQKKPSFPLGSSGAWLGGAGRSLTATGECVKKKHEEFLVIRLLPFGN